MSKQTVQIMLRACRWVPLVLCFLFIILVLFRIPAVTEKEKTQAAVARIHAQKITMGDVLGTNTPPAPDPAQNNATLKGIDANNNGIRDDVELALFDLKPKQNPAAEPKTDAEGFAQAPNIRIRAAQLQYARTLQSYLTDVFNKETWEAVAVQDDRAYQCLGQAFRQAGMSEDDLFPAMETRVAYLKGLVFNTPMRKDAYKKAMNFITGFGLENFTVCDVDPAALPQ